MKKVLVTGANGHLGFTVTKYLAQKGYEVYAGVRNPTDKSKTKLLKKLPVKLTELDITNKKQALDIMKKVEGVFHIAAAFSLSGKKQDIINQTVQGAMNIIESAYIAGVKKIIYTSSSRALGAVSTKEEPLNSKSWNNDCKVPYFLAKIIAEKKVLEYANKTGMNVVSVIPSIILGPNINRFSESTDVIRKILENKLPVIAPISFNFVDVRDVAMAHIAAYENENANGRYIVGNDPIYLNDLINKIAASFQIQRPKVSLSKNTFVFSTYLMAMLSLFTRNKQDITPQQAKEFTKGIRYLDISRIKDEFGITLRPIDETISDTVNYILDNQLISSKVVKVQ